MKSCVLCMVILLIPLISSCNATNIEGIIKNYGYDAQKKKPFIVLVTGKIEKKYYYSSNPLFVANHVETQVSQDRMMAGASIYSFSHYPRKTKLTLDKNLEIIRIDVIFVVLKGYIENFDPDKNIIKIKKALPHKKKMIQDDLGEHAALPGINQWAWKSLAERNEIDLLVGSNATLRYNYKVIHASEIEKYIGKEIHVVLDDHLNPYVFNIYDFNEKVWISRAACSGYVLKWNSSFSEVSIWEPLDMNKMLNDFYSPKIISNLIKQNKMKQEFILKAQYKFSENAVLYINGEKQQPLSSHYRSLRNSLEVNSCFYYGSTYLKYNKKGEVETIIVPYEELE